MNVDALRLADRYIGLPMCWALTVARAVAQPFKRRSPPPPPRKVLIIKLSEMGSTVLSYPAFLELKRRIPDIELFFLTFGENSAIFPPLALTPEDHTIVVDTDSVGRLITSGLRAMKILLRARLDTVIDMDFLSRFSAALAFLLCRGNRVGFHGFSNEGQGRGNLLTHRILYSPHIHTREAFMAEILALFSEQTGEIHYKGSAREMDYSIPRHEPDTAAVEALRQKLETLDIAPENNGTRLVLVNPNSSNIFPLRKWPFENYVDFCNRLLDEHADIRIAITGGRSEKVDAQRMAEHVGNPRCVSLAGQTTFPELLALYACASLMITNDSGPGHFASLLDLPAVVLFGPETPRLYAPLGNRVRCLYSHFACSPCVSVYNAKKSPCRNNRCMQAITVDQVMQEAGELLAG